MDAEFETEYLIEDGGDAYEEEPIQSTSKQDTSVSSDDQNNGKVVVMYLEESAEMHEENATEKKTRKRSDMWRYFESIDRERAQCLLCKNTYRYLGSISNLRKHLARKHTINDFEQQETYKPVKSVKKKIQRQHSSGKIRSDVWNHYDMVGENMARCHTCSRIFTAKNDSTSNLFKHYRRCPKKRQDPIETKNKTIRNPIKTEVDNNERAQLYFTKVKDDTYICGRCEDTFVCKKTENLIYHVCSQQMSVNVWDYFEERPPGFALCLMCRNEIEYTTINQLVAHLKVKHHMLRNKNNESNVKTEVDSNDYNTQNPLSEVNEDMLKIFINKKIPFDLFSDKYFKQLLEEQGVDDLPNENFIENIYIPLLMSEKIAEVKNKLEKIDNLCLTVDVWGVRTVFMSLSVHFFENFERESMILNTWSFRGFPNETVLRGKFVKFVEDWNIQIDLAVSNNSKIVNVFRDAGWPYFDCFLIKYAELCDNILHSFKTIVKKIEKCSKSCFSVLQYIVNSNGNDLKLTKHEKIIFKDLVIILKPYSDIYIKLRNEKYIHSSMPIVITSSLLTVSEKNLNLINTDTVKNALKRSIDDLKSILDEYEHDDALTIATFLDPRFKLHCFRNQNAVKLVKDRVESAIKPKSNVCQVNQTSNKRVSVFDAIDSIVKSAVTGKERQRQEIDMYLKDKLLDAERMPALWWQERASIYPNLYELYVKNCHTVANCQPCSDFLTNDRFDARFCVKKKHTDAVLFLSQNI